MNIVLSNPSFSSESSICHFYVENINIEMFDLSTYDKLSILTDSVIPFFDLELNLIDNSAQFVCYVAHDEYDNIYFADATEEIVNQAMNIISTAVNSAVDY